MEADFVNRIAELEAENEALRQRIKELETPECDVCGQWSHWGCGHRTSFGKSVASKGRETK